jgi:hypothetical protein
MVGCFFGMILFVVAVVMVSVNLLMPSGSGFSVRVIRSTGEVVLTYGDGLKKMLVAGVDPAPFTCGNAPTVLNSDGGNAAAALALLGDTVQYVCGTGFTAAGTSQVTTCQSDTTWSAVSQCQSDADVIIQLLGNSTDVKSTLEVVVKALDILLCGSTTSQVYLQRWCQLRSLQF